MATIITEFVRIEVLQTTTRDQLLSKAEVINSFIREQDGFLDAELIMPIDGNICYFIYHIENMDKLKATGEKLRNNRLFDEITPLIVPGSMSVMFSNQVKKWMPASY